MTETPLGPDDPNVPEIDLNPLETTSFVTTEADVNDRAYVPPTAPGTESGYTS